MDAHETDAELALFMPWGADGRPASRALVDRDVLLEIKSAEAAASGEDLRCVLNDLTAELKAQFATFKRLRLAAEKTLDEAGCDEATAKLAKADIKAASEAISQIVRTLEKVDNLQRSMADARASAADDAVTDAEIDAMCDVFAGLIEERARELARRYADGNGADDAPGSGEMPDPGG
ncbi:hypothetical protein [Rhizobium sp. L1K21]|uniref:hypothetical protein n=1 Tax=Rhizobium sp. L1K21 TaxID=2954933 RepID=UPI002093AE26|nr:hypothetical protein [Rhizobium sp. L1K21]MCO6186704.1 hypothetical protein [Rhizobium sp. L1K21]